MNLKILPSSIFTFQYLSSIVPVFVYLLVDVFVYLVAKSSPSWHSGHLAPVRAAPRNLPPGLTASRPYLTLILLFLSTINSS